MTGRFAVDFGTSNTVVAMWDETKQDAFPIEVPQYSHRFTQAHATLPVIPSLIYYSSENQQWIGQQVIDRDLYQSPHTFRWMKRYITSRSPYSIKINGVPISPLLAGSDFLRNVLLFSMPDLSAQDDEVAFSAPVEAFEHYENWLSEVASSAGINRYRIIDEPSAAALGYGAHIQPGDVYLVFDFGGGTMHASVIRIEPETGDGSGRRCRVLGKAGYDIGGSTIDQWMYEDILQKYALRESDAITRRISNTLLVGCEKVKETLSVTDATSVEITDTETSAVFEVFYSQSTFVELLDKHDLFTEMERVLRSSFSYSREKGFDESTIKSVFMVGGSSQIPAVQNQLKRTFGKEMVSCNRPLDAVARGAASFVAGVEFFDHIQHTYAIRYLDPAKNTYEFRILVERGSPYPSLEPVARLFIKPSYSGQTHLGLSIFELGDPLHRSTGKTELVFDPSGAARLVEVTPQQSEDRTRFWMNETNPTFLVAEPASDLNTPVFECLFSIDSNKRLIVTARDLRSGKLVLDQHPVIKLV
jgi:molecular chaperone DnaK (HSP70)